MKKILAFILLTLMLSNAVSAQIPFSTIGQIYNFDVNDTMEFSCSTNNYCSHYLNYSYMNVVQAKDSTGDSVSYLIKTVTYSPSQQCMYHESGSASTSTHLYTHLDSSAFWYHTYTPQSYATDTTPLFYIDTAYADTAKNNHKANEHTEGGMGCCGNDTILMDGLGEIRFTSWDEDFLYPQGGCQLQYYHKAGGEIWGTPPYIKITTGISNLDDDFTIDIGPNPAHDILNIAGNNTVITGISLYTISGALLRVIDRPLDMPLDISDVTPGVYIARIETMQGLRIRKWIKI